MAKQLLIKAKLRENKKPNALRESGFIPATLYGHSFESKSIQVSAKEFSKVPHRAYSHVNLLEVEGGENYDVLIKNVQVDPVKNIFLNVEFYRITKGEKVKVKVPIRYVGHSPAVVAGGVLIVAYNELEIQCLPKDIPDDIEVNLEEITEIGQSIHIKDLKSKVGEAIAFLQHHDEVVVRVETPKEHKVEEEVPAAEAEALAAAPEAKVEGEAPAPAQAKEATKKEEPKEKTKEKGK